MNPVSKRTWIAISLAGAFIGLSASAIAQINTPTPAATLQAQTVPEAQAHRHHTERRAQRMERMKNRMAEHQARLKENLKLTASQEPAWNAFVADMQPPSRAHRHDDRDAWTQLTTPQRLERMEAMKAQRDQAMTKRHGAIRSFYAQLSEEQRKTFDAQAMSGMQRSGMRGNHGGPHHGEGHGSQRM